MRRLLLLDNYDSFVFNIAQMLDELACPYDIAKNDTVDFNRLGVYTHCILSPGPGLPNEAGRLMDVIDHMKGGASILGVCLGHQAVAEYFGAKMKNIPPKHGYASVLKTVNGGDHIFNGLESLRVGRYHSWVVENLPGCLIPTSVDEKGEIMSLKHASLDVRGVQFHPESIMTPCGKGILSNWLNG